MQLHELISVRSESEAGVYVARVDITDATGQRYTTDYISRDDDDFGLAPEIRAAINQWIADAVPVLPYMEPQPTLEDYRLAIDAHVNDVARAKDYNDAATLAGYVNSTVPQWAGDAATFVVWRDQVWMHAFNELARVEAAERSQPSVHDFLAELPPIVWQSSD